MILRRPNAIIALVLLVMTSRLAVAADTQRAATVPLPPVQPPAGDPAPLPPYQAKLDRLAEVMGTLTFLHTLCGDADATAWRTRMQALLDAEGITTARRERLAGSFNRGYAGYQVSYRTCTSAAETAMTRSQNEGARIAADVAAQYGTP